MLRYTAQGMAGDLTVDEQIQLMEEAADYAARVGDLRSSITLRGLIARLQALRGEWTATEAALDALPSDYSLGLALRSYIADVRGDSTTAIAVAGQIAITSEASRAFILGSRMRSLLVAGRSEEASVVASEASEFVRAASALEGLIAVADFATAALLDEDAARVAYDWRRGISAGFESYLSGAFWRVPLALRLGEIDEAERIAREQLDHAIANRLPLQEGRCHQGLAEVAEQRGDLESAQEHLDAAGELFAQLGAKLYLDQVIAKKEILKA